LNGSSFNSSVGLGERSRNTSQQDKARDKHLYGEFQWFHLEKIFTGPKSLTSRATATDTLNGGDSVGVCLHPGLVNCQLDIAKDCQYF
jgi:hypothetical protein